MFEARTHETLRFKVNTVDVPQEQLPVGAVIASPARPTAENPHDVELLIVTQACADHPRGWLFVRHLDWSGPRHTGDTGTGFFNFPAGHVFHRVVQTDPAHAGNPHVRELQALIDAA